jgi:ribosomal protein S18 acetylase RimI-like enzyme
VDSAQPIAIRPATDADLPALEWDGEYQSYRRLFRKAMAEARRGRRLLLLAEIDGQIVGQIFIQLSAASGLAPAEGRFGYLYAFRVKRAHRNQGIGTRLLEVAEARLRDLGYRRAVISAARQNAAAIRLYRRLDYQVFAKDPGEWSYIDHVGRRREVREPSYLLEKWL